MKIVDARDQPKPRTLKVKEMVAGDVGKATGTGAVAMRLANGLAINLARTAPWAELAEDFSEDYELVDATLTLKRLGPG